MSMSVIICGTDKDPASDHYRCTCCGFTSDNREGFYGSSCWTCAFSGNPDCTNCVALGVIVSGFREHCDGHSHVLADSTTTVCGRTLAAHEMTGPGDKPMCATCALDPRTGQ